MAAPKMTKNQMRRARRKEQKKAAQEEAAAKRSESTEEKKPEETVNGEQEQPADAAPEVKKDEKDADEKKTDDKKTDDKDSDDTKPAKVEDVHIELDYDDEALSLYRDVFKRFGATLDEDEVAKEANAGNTGEVFYHEDDEIPSEDEENQGQTRLSKKKRKQLNKLSIAELKALVKIPEVVEWQDVSSSDPRLLVQIKAQKNVVPVPTHWSLKREYLSSKRGIEKPPFRLPAFIAETGITEMRDAVLEKQDQQSLKQKQRERVAPKMGKLDIDYQKLYDAFFRFQTKPPLTRFGEVYYEGKENEGDFQHFRAGELSDGTKEALGMPPGAPPPWLINQQRFGPPPSYPTLKIPGLNAPPPPGGSWGFHPGGWGKPPVDEFNRPLYGGDIFGLGNQAADAGAAAAGAPQAAQPLPTGEPVDKTLWGELQPREEESEEEESDEDESDEEDEEDVPGGTEPATGLETPAGMASSVPTDYPGHGVETSIAGELDLRKQRRGFDTEESAHPRAAYQVIPERQQRTEGFFGSDRVYDLPQQRSAGAHLPVLGQDDDSGRKRKKPGDVDVALDPESLQHHDGIDKEELQRRFDEGRRQEGVGAKWSYEEDLSEMIAQESRKRQKVEEKRSEKKRETKYKF
ncbi:hypothetical protein ACRALDRAFT_1043803 [Sodiomyces alcalophilus JCM 7366]|uniref:uncharacterized protein n=1 Tax=Sodiomyces alcalophilus JCM 7366 TaxID=591952 RepID=UPI0039B3B5CE